MNAPMMGELRGARVARHFGDPSAEYRAATAGLALRHRSHRRRWTVTGRQPSAMLAGVVTGRMPEPWAAAAEGVRAGRAEYSVVLTPKGRMISDLRLWRADGAAGEEAALLLDVPVAGAEALEAHFRRFLPPRLARVTDVTDTTAMTAVLGPQAAAALAVHASGLHLEAADLTSLVEGEFRAIDVGGDQPLVVIRSAQVSVPAWDVVGSRDDVAALDTALGRAGATPVGSGVWEALRLEAGRPAFGAELTDEFIPVEAGVHSRAIDYDKGCYTGQEVIIRLRDRGHVNRHLRRLRLPEGPTPPADTELWRADGDKAVGRITSAVVSPREGPLALGYVRREVQPGGVVRVGRADGPEARVESLDDLGSGHGD